MTYSFQIFGAVIVLIMGFFLRRKLRVLVLKICEKKNLEITLSRIFASGIRIAAVAAAFVIALPKLGDKLPFLLLSLAPKAWVLDWQLRDFDLTTVRA